jgi:hypothetical protein
VIVPYHLFTALSLERTGEVLVEDFEKMGAFYLGRAFDPQTKKPGIHWFFTIPRIW